MAEDEMREMGKKPKKGSKDQGVLGIDWDGDGKVSMADDFISMDLLDGGGGCLLFLVCLPAELLWMLIKGSGIG